MPSFDGYTLVKGAFHIPHLDRLRPETPLSRRLKPNHIGRRGNPLHS
jgi:hypothetical protein